MTILNQNTQTFITMKHILHKVLLRSIFRSQIIQFSYFINMIFEYFGIVSIRYFTKSDISWVCILKIIIAYNPSLP